METIHQHTRPPPFPISVLKNAHLSGWSEDLDPWPRVSLGSRFFLTHPMLPGATSVWKITCKCLDIMMISLLRLSDGFSAKFSQVSVINTDIKLFFVRRPVPVLEKLDPGSLQPLVIKRDLPISWPLLL